MYSDSNTRRKPATLPRIFKKQWGSPLEQTTEPDDNHENEIPQQISEDDQSTQKSQKDTNNPSEDGLQKTPENSQNTPLQEEPINSCGEKYNLRPNHNPNYSNSYRY